MKYTTDLWFVCFLVRSGHEVEDYLTMKNNKVRFLFDISDSEWKRLKLSFQKSDVMDIKLIYEKTLNLIY